MAGCRRSTRGLRRQPTSSARTGLAERWQAARRQIDRDAFTFYLDPREYRTTPIDLIPRIVPGEHWDMIAEGVGPAAAGDQPVSCRRCTRRARQDIVPPDVVYSSDYFFPEVQGFRPPKDVFVHIYGIDLVHMGGGRYVVLEDNLRIRRGSRTS